MFSGGQIGLPKLFEEIADIAEFIHVPSIGVVLYFFYQLCKHSFSLLLPLLKGEVGRSPFESAFDLFPDMLFCIFLLMLIEMS
jgi:hypothetical protein